MTFKYQRSEQHEDLLHDHRINMFEAYGERFADVPHWMQPRITKLYDRAHDAIANLLATIAETRHLDYSEYKEKIAELKKSKLLEDSRMQILDILKKEMKDTNSNVRNLQHRIMEETSYHPEKADIHDQLNKQEIRRYLLTLPLKERRLAVEAAFKEKNLDVVTAVASAPIPIMDVNQLNDLRREYAFANNTQLKDAYDDATALAKTVRAKAGSINATAVSILLKEDLLDPITARQHFAVFEPENDHKAWAANKLIQHDEERRAAAEAKAQDN